MEWLKLFITQNDFLAGGIGITAFASILYGFKNAAIHFYQFIVNYCIRTVRINNSDYEIYSYASDWIYEKMGNKSKRLMFVNSSLRGNGAYRPLLSYGTHFYFSGLGLVTVKIEEEKTENTLARKESVKIRFWIFAKSQYQDFIDYCTKRKKEEHSLKYIQNVTQYGLGIVNRRPLSSIFIDPITQQEILNDLNMFFSNKEKYIEKGIPYKRGFLLYGEPGTGKSSLVKALGCHFKRNVKYINLSVIEDDKQFQEVLHRIEENCFILLDDLDCLPATKERRTKDHSPDSEGLKMSTILNFLDGDWLPEGCVVWGTTNHFDKLDSAIIRDGRFDKKIELKKADKSIAKRMADHFGLDNQEFLDKLQYPIEQAKLQNILLKKSG